MKNILLKSAQIFVLMSFINFLLSVLILYMIRLPGGNFGMHPFLILIECSFVSVVAFITVVIFKKNYHSILKMAFLFEIIYLICLVLSGFNPYGTNDEHVFSLLTYLNSLITFYFVYFFNFLYSKLIFKKIKKTNIDQ
jgi:hypothetical protein